MSFGKSKSKSTGSNTGTTSGTQTITPTVAPWLEGLYQGQGQTIAGLAGSGQPLTSGASPLQSQAFSAASQLLQPQTQPAGGATGYGGGMAQPKGMNQPQVNGGGGDGYTPPAPSGPTSQPPNGDPFSPEYQSWVYQQDVARDAARSNPMQSFEGSSAAFNPDGTANGDFNQASAAINRSNNAGANTARSTGYNPAYADLSQLGVGRTGAATAGNFSDTNLTPYMRDYNQGVVDPTLADFDEQAGIARARQSGMAALNGGGRNSNNSIQAAQLEGELSRGRATTAAGLRDQAFTRGAGLATGDLDRQAGISTFNRGIDSSTSQLEAQLRASGIFGNQGAANDASQFGANAFNTNQQFNAGQSDNFMNRLLQGASLSTSNGTARGNDTRGNIGLASDLGGQQRDIANSQTPTAQAAMIQALLAGLPIDAFTTRTVNSNGTTSGTSTGTQSGTTFGASLSDIGTLMKMSDERLKREIRTEGFDQQGRRWVSWRYIWDETKRHFGVIAQELLRTDPHAVHVHPSGYLMVNYGALDGTV